LDGGRAKDWQRFEKFLYLGLATPLISVHTIVSMDFATSVIPGWHTTIFPPLCGWELYSGLQW
jgi:molybdopterin-containing oxidoreductase family membrane subunit